MARIRFDERGDRSAEGTWSVPDLPKTTSQPDSFGQGPTSLYPSSGGYGDFSNHETKTTPTAPDWSTWKGVVGPSAGQPNAINPNDPRAVLSGVFAKYGLDPMNPGSGLGNVDYFVGRAGETGGGWGNEPNRDYWQRRLAQEIEKATTGKMGDLIDTGGPGIGQFGYDDPSSKLFLGEVMKRLEALRTPVHDDVLDTLRSLSLKRVDALNGAPYTAGEDAALRAHYLEPLTMARDAALQRNKDAAGAHGYLPSSGLVSRNDAMVEQGYERAVGQAANDTALQAIDEKQRRGQEQLQILASLLDANRSGRSEQDARARELLATAEIFPNFDEKRLATLLGASGEGATSPGSALSSLLNLSSTNTNRQYVNDSRDGQSASAWGQLLGWLLSQG